MTNKNYIRVGDRRMHRQCIASYCSRYGPSFCLDISLVGGQTVTVQAADADDLFVMTRDLDRELGSEWPDEREGNPKGEPEKETA